ncbi:MAG TPA: PD-(D/E)XK nuclease family protein [Gaiellaceae bacterium]|nr:PD-(D/E)XK nuclease family protein [Gaiellaceae bacterium]
MPLSLLAGPANAGKVALLLERYLAALESDPILIVPNRPDVDRAERELLERTGALVGGSIGTFADLFERIARGNGAHRPVITDAQRTLLLRRIVARHGTGRSARFSGFADSLAATVSELESALLDPAELDGELAELYAAYREELDRLGLWDRELERRHAAERAAGDLSAWKPRPVFAYGFEDLTGAEWALVEALAARADVTVSLPYEPGRDAFASLSRTADDLTRLADGRIEELPPSPAARAPVLAHLERALFPGNADAGTVELDGAVRFLEGAGIRGTLELVADEILGLLREGTAAAEIAIVCPSVDRWRTPLDTAFTTLGVAYALEGRLKLGQTPFGQALLSLLRYAWLEGERRELFSFLRSPYSGLTRAHADFLEGRLRGRGVVEAPRVEEEIGKLRAQPLPHLDVVRGAADPLAAVRDLGRAMARAAYGLDAPPVHERARSDLRAHEGAAKLVAELEGWRDLGGEATREEVVALLADAPVRLAGANEAGRVAVLDLLRARTRRFEVVFVVGLEEGRLPRRGQGSPFLDDERKDELERASRSGRLLRTDPVSRDRYLFYTACTRPTRRLYLVREAASDDGAPREPSPFWEEARGLFDADDVERWTRQRPLAALTWRLEAAPSERERLRALAALAPTDRTEATSLARANGWERRVERALGAFQRATRLTHPAVLEELRQKATFSVTDLERFAECSSMWFVDRLVAPRNIDAEVDARLRGTVAHQALFSFFKGLPKRTGDDRPRPENLDDALEFLRECLRDALEAHVRIDVPGLERRELEQGLARDLEKLVRREAESPSPLVPSRFEVSFGSERSAPELQRGLDLGGFNISGKIDRIDRDPFGARGVVVDYKSGRSAHSAAEIERELHLQIPLYMLVLRDLVGVEPLGGIYRALAGEGQARGLLRAEAKEDGLPGFQRNDYVDEDAFWGQIERAQEHAQTVVGRIREGDVRHDPKRGSCPQWCELWPMCRVKRS